MKKDDDGGGILLRWDGSRRRRIMKLQLQWVRTVGSRLLCESGLL
jgi:hypothetical protein